MSVTDLIDDEAGLERLANAVLWPGFFGRTVPAWLDAALRRGLAGVVYFGQNIGPDLATLSADIRAANPRALIGVDEEGGSVTRLEAATGSTLPGAAQLGALDDTAATAATGAELARRVRAVGADVVLGPVADVNTDPRNPVIGVRSFGADADLVARHVVAAVQGIQGGGVAACVKHFPGHGDTHLDSHHDLPRITADPAEIERVHLAPFSAAVAAGVAAVMTAHIVVPAWGEEPATLNPRVLGMLRSEGFDGVIITDALDMAAIRESVGIGAGAVRALAAGADLLCIGNPTNPGAAARTDQDEHDYRTARDAIVAALADGTLSRERVAEAGARVAALAATLAAQRPSAAAGESGFDGADIVRRALRVRGSLPEAPGEPFVIDARRSSSLAVDSAAGYVSEALAGGARTVRLDTARWDTAQRDAAVAAALDEAQGRRIALLVDRIDTDPAQRGLVAELVGRGADVVAVNVGLPAEDPAVTVIEVGSASRIGAELARERLIGTAR